jgi:hypothetical protein
MQTKQSAFPAKGSTQIIMISSNKKIRVHHHNHKNLRSLVFISFTP